MKRLFFCAATALLSGSALYAQPAAPAILHSGLYGGTGDDHPRCIYQERDSGYLIGGWTFSSDEHAESPFKTYVNGLVIRTDAKGNFRWSRVLAGSAYDNVASVSAYGDKVIVGGDGISTDGDFAGMPEKKGYIAWLDSADGHLLRIRHYTGDGGGAINKLRVLKGGKLLVCGYKFHLAGGKGPEGSAAWVALLDDTGSVIWERFAGGTPMWASGSGASVIQKADGGYMMLATISPISGSVSVPGHHGKSDFMLLNMDRSGNVLWMKFYGGADSDVPIELIETQDGGFICGGFSSSTEGDISKPLGNSDYWVFKVDKDGKMLWERSLGGSLNEYIGGMAGTCDNGVILYGHTFSKDGLGDGLAGAADMLLIRLDNSGTILWHKLYGSSQGDWEGSITTTREGHYAFAGVTGFADRDVTGTIRGSGDYWLAILGDDSLDNYCPIETPEPVGVKPDPAVVGALKVYPNPVQGQLIIESSAPVLVTLRDLQGRVLLQSGNGSLDMSSLAAGMYLLTCTDTQGNYLSTHKIHRN